MSYFAAFALCFVTGLVIVLGALVVVAPLVERVAAALQAVGS